MFHENMLPPKFDFSFCPTRNEMTVGVRRDEGYFKYSFNEKTQNLEALQCRSCQPIVTEKQLMPLYAVFDEKIRDHVIFAANTVSAKVEQYMLNMTTGGFEQVYRPEFVFNQDQPMSEEVICTIEETIEHELTLVRRGVLRNIEKMRYITKVEAYASIPPRPVKTLIQEESKKNDVIPRVAINRFGDLNLDDEEGCPPFYIEFSIEMKKDIVCARRPDGTTLRFSYNDSTGEFENVNCFNPMDSIFELNLFPIYSVYCPPMEQYVMFAKNHANNMKIEQYTLCPVDFQFKRVNIPGLKFDADQRSDVQFCVENSEGGYTVAVTKDNNGRVQKFVYFHNNPFPQMAAPLLVVPLSPEPTVDFEEQDQFEEEDVSERCSPISDAGYITGSSGLSSPVSSSAPSPATSCSNIALTFAEFLTPSSPELSLESTSASSSRSMTPTSEYSTFSSRCSSPGLSAGSSKSIYSNVIDLYNNSFVKLMDDWHLTC